MTFSPCDTEVSLTRPTSGDRGFRDMVLKTTISPVSNADILPPPPLRPPTRSCLISGDIERQHRLDTITDTSRPATCADGASESVVRRSSGGLSHSVSALLFRRSWRPAAVDGRRLGTIH